MLAADGKTVEGFDVDVFNAVAASSASRPSGSRAGFDSITSASTGGQVRHGPRSFTINDERKKQVNTVSYDKAGNWWIVAKGNPKGVNMDDACGKNIGAQKGTVQLDDLTARPARSAPTPASW